MNKRNCPVCGSDQAGIIMKFTPELIAAVNPTYRLEKFKDAVSGNEEALAYSKCKDCGMIYCEHIWDNDTLNKVYSDVIDHAKSKDKAYLIQKRISMARLWTNILRVLQVLGKNSLEGIKLIDYGSGWGDFLDVVRGVGISAMGYDTDHKKSAAAIERGHNIALSTDGLLSFAPADVLVMNSVLEHLQDVEFHLNLVKRLLKRNGLFVFSVMDYRPGYISKNKKLLERDLPAMTKNLNPVEHVNIYDHRSAMATLEKYGFTFITTGKALFLADILGARNGMGLIKIMNCLEWLSAKIFTGKEMSITVFALIGNKDEK